ATSFNQNIGAWDVSSVTTMTKIFDGATSFNQDISAWKLKPLINLSNMFDNSGLSTENYDTFLIHLASSNLGNDIVLGAIGINYCNGKDARDILVWNFGWSITDAGLDCSSLSLESNNVSYSIYPNPTNSEINIKGNLNYLEISIYNVLGKKVLVENNSDKIDVRQLPSGTYIIRIFDGERQTNKKFIKF
ncbi:MAG: BspA family leucine-rich repeat surface protein, partial [Polaribacter sp.]|nr:BspA family leucine-rich repeat surface protein [Polaribacter sp.]